MLTRALRTALPAALSIALLSFAATASATTVGVLPPNDQQGSCAGVDYTSADTVFSADGTINSLSYKSSQSVTGPADFQVLRPTGNTEEYTVIGIISTPGSSANNAVITVPVSPAFAVKSGDRLAISVASGQHFPCVGVLSGHTTRQGTGVSAPQGSTITFAFGPYTDQVLNLAADFTAGAATTATTTATATANVGSYAALSGGSVDYGTILPTILASTYDATSSLLVSTSSSSGIDVTVSAPGNALGITNATQTVTVGGVATAASGSPRIVHATTAVNSVFTFPWRLTIAAGTVLIQGTTKQQTLTYTATGGL